MIVEFNLGRGQYKRAAKERAKVATSVREIPVKASFPFGGGTDGPGGGVTGVGGFSGDGGGALFSSP